jgi:NhaP-type Na+/H+ or K+/H+ antiporter
LAKINVGRVIVGGIVAGIVINIFEFVLNGVVLAKQWTDLMVSLNRPALGMHEIVAFNIVGFVLGLAAVWTYAAIRPRFGAGPKTAVYAALLTWVTGYVLADGMPTIMGVYPHSMMPMLIGVGLVEIVVATWAGAYFYKEAV